MSHLTSPLPSGDGSIPDAVAAPGSKVKVWDLPTRVFHWSLASSFVGAWLTAESERWRDIHVVCGYTLAGLIVFRLVWGIVGSRYARFNSFAFPPSRVLGYLKSLLSGAPEHHLGHNPAGALAIWALLLLGVFASASGYATYNEVLGASGEWLEDLHEVAANAMLGLVIIHLVGVVMSSFLHKENLVRAMVTGWKNGRSEDGIKRSHTALGVALLAVVLGFWGFSQSAAGQAFLGGAGESSGIEQQDRKSSMTSDRQWDGSREQRKRKDRDDD